MRRARLIVVLSALALFLGACQSTSGSQGRGLAPTRDATTFGGDDNPSPSLRGRAAAMAMPDDGEVRLPWVLHGGTPDGRTLGVHVVPQSCEDVQRLVLVEDDDTVEVVAVGSPPAAGLGCPAVEISVPGRVRLTAPLGDRQLVGCEPTSGRASCRDSGGAVLEGATLVDGGLAVGVDGADIVAWDLATGAQRWRRQLPRDGPVQLTALSMGILVKDDGLLLLDRDDGSVLAEVTPGWVGPNDPAVGTDPVVVRDRGDLKTLHALEPEDLSLRWTVEVPAAESLGNAVVPLDGGRTAAQANRPGGGADLIILDRDGHMEMRTPLAGGALVGQHAGRLVLAGGDGRLRTLDQAGTVLSVAEPTPGFVYRVEAGIALVQVDDTVVAVDVVTGNERWLAEGWPPPTWIPEQNLLVRARDALVLEATAARTGAPRWQLDSTGQQPVGGCTPDRLLAQAVAIVAIRSTDGCVAWWQPRFPAAEVVAGS